MVKIKRIYLDMDGVLVNLMAGWIPYLNEMSGKNLTHEDVDMWGIEYVYGIPFSRARKPLHKPGFWENLPPYPGAIKAVEDLYGEGFEIFIATAPFPSDNCAWEKKLWVDKHLPFLPYQNLAILASKHILDGEGAVLVDDKPDNLRWFGGVKVLWDQPWNKKLPDGHAEWWYTRLSAWSDLKEFMIYSRDYGIY